MRLMLDGIRGNLRKSLQAQKDQMGFNLAALRVVSTQVKDRGTKEYVDEETWEDNDTQGQRKRGFVHVS